MTQEMDYRMISLMAEDKPLAVYRKAKGILGKVEVKVFNSLTQQIEKVMLEGNPSDLNCDTCFVEIWSEKEHIFFKRANKWHLNEGYIVPYTKERPNQIQQTVNNMTDDEMEALVKKPFLALKAAVDQMTTEAALIRIIKIAEEADKPEKTMAFLKERLALLQSGELETEN